MGEGSLGERTGAVQLPPTSACWASQARSRSIELSYVTGFRAFLSLGRALWVLALHTVRIKAAEGSPRR
jgi:hypothetical protein